MKIKCQLELEYEDEQKTENIHRSLKVDNFDYVKSQKNKKNINANIESNSIKSLLHTLDDYLACLTVAEKIVNKEK